MNKEYEDVEVTMENAIEYFKSHCKIFCDDYMKKVPKNSIAYQATLTEKGFYDLAIKALKKAREEKSLVYNNEEPSVFSCENCKYELLSPEVEPCCDCKNAHKNYFEAKISEVMEMTRGKCKEVLQALWRYKDCGYSENEIRESLDMAIKAIEEPSVNETLDKIRAEIEQNSYLIVHGLNNYELGMTLYGILQIIDKYKEESEESE